MGYELHLTRAESWYEDEEPITFCEAEAALHQFSEGFTIDREGIVTAVTPQGQILSADMGPFIVCYDGKNEDSRIHIYFEDGHSPHFQVRRVRALLPVIALADALHAKVQGDEEEIYTMESVLEEDPEEL